MYLDFGSLPCTMGRGNTGWGRRTSSHEVCVAGRLMPRILSVETVTLRRAVRILPVVLAAKARVRRCAAMWLGGHGARFRGGGEPLFVAV